MRNKKCFTLIELLMVIAIIGLLSSIILASLGTARNKARDATIQGQMSGMRSAAALYFGSQNPNRYGPNSGTDCTNGSVFTDNTSNMVNLLKATFAAAGGTWSAQDNSIMDCASNDTNWAVATKLPSGAGFLCVDSSGIVRSSFNGMAGTNGTPANATYAKTTYGNTICQ